VGTGVLFRFSFARLNSLFLFSVSLNSSAPLWIKCYLSCLTWTQLCMKMSVESVSALPLNSQSIASPPEGAYKHALFQNGSLLVQVSCTTGKRCQPSKDRWEGLKPLIRRVYLGENKTVQQLAEILRDEHDFFPTYAPTRLPHAGC